MLCARFCIVFIIYFPIFKLLSVENHVSYVCDGDFDARIGFDFLTNLVAGVNDCGVISSAKHFAYLHKRHRQQLGDEIDCDHPRFDDVFGFLFGDYIRGRKFEILANSIHDSACVYRVLFLFDKSAYCLFGNVYGAYGAVCERAEEDDSVEQSFHFTNV